MRDSHEELGRRLFASVRRERPSAELRERVLALGRAERARLTGGRVRRAPLAERFAARWTKRRLGWSLGLAAGVALVFAIVRGGADRPDIVMSAERSGDTAATAPGPKRTDELAIRKPAEAPQPPPASVAARGRQGPTKKPTRALPGTKEDAGPARSEARRPLAEQLEQIRNARWALRGGDPVRALALLDAYQARSSGGELGAEASLLRIEAIAASGRREEAAQLARKFAAEHPNSPLIDRALTFARE